MLTFIAVSGIAMPVRAAIYRFSPTEHKPILPLSQQFALEPVNLSEGQGDFFVEFLEKDDGSYSIEILPRSVRIAYRLLWYGAVDTARTLARITEDGNYTALQTDTSEAAYRSFRSEGGFLSFKPLTLSDAIVRLKQGDRSFAFGEGHTAEIPSKTIRGAVGVQVTTMSPQKLPAGLSARSSHYRFKVDDAEALDVTVPTTVKMKYTGEDSASKSVYYFDEASLEWKQAPSYNHVEDRVVTATLPSFSTMFVLAERTAADDGIASWYNYRKCLCAASRHYAKGTRLKVTRLKTGMSVIVTVNDYGPEEWTGRLIDLDAVAFKKIGSLGAGLVYVSVEPVK